MSRELPVVPRDVTVLDHGKGKIRGPTESSVPT